MTTDALYWYGSIFLWLFFTGIGLPPVPEEAGILYAAGVHALHPEALWPFCWLACGVGIVAADCVLYGVGRQFGPRLFEFRWVQKVLSAERRQRLEGRFHNHGMKLLVMARFMPPLRTGIFLIAGAARYSFVKFLLADLVYAVVGVGALFFGGSFVLDLVHRVGYQAIWFAVVPLVGYGLYRYYRYLKKRELGAAPPVSVLQSPAGDVPEGQPAMNPGGAVAAMKEAKAALKD
ncbi:MAG: DedA family protein [Gemmataceae bacterium]|nr:DedA family protein [Gemmataceae bacterium]